ncbi:MAG: hypothetical protein KDD62_11795, partial [Bdellovibrionales bacterium]|nr:hypothetical protein [Bdellovibrionales bacterium]
MSFSRQVSVFVKSLIGQSLEGVVFNPFQRKLGDTLLLPNGLKVALVGIADVVEKDEGIGVFHNTFYFLNEVTEGEPRRFLITMASKPDEQATHCCLLELVEARTYSDFVDGDQLDEVDDEYEYGGKTW